MTVFEVPTGRPLPVKYNVQWGYKSNHSSIMNMSDALAMYTKKVRLILQKNKHLARELAASQKKVSKLEKANKRQQKIENLALPRLKTWLEAGMQCIDDVRINYARAIRFLQDIMTPERDFTLTGAADTDEPSTRQDPKPPPLHPQGKPSANKCGNFTVIPEENESTITSRCPSPQVTTQDPEVGQSPTLSMLMDIDNGEDTISGFPVSPLESLEFSPQALETTLIAAEQVAISESAIAASVKSRHKISGPEMSPIFSAEDKEADDTHLTDDSPSSSKQFRVPAKPWKSVGNVSGSRTLGSRRRSSLSATGHGRRHSSMDESPESFWPETARRMSGEREAPGDVSLLSSTCLLDGAFVETSSFFAVQSSPAIPEKTAMPHAGEGRPQEAKAASKKSPKQSHPSTGSARPGKTPRVSRGVSEGKEKTHASRPGNVGHDSPSAASTEAPTEAEKATPPPAELQTAKTSRRRSKPSAEPIFVSPATDDDSVPRYASGRPARRCSLGKNYK